MGKIYEKTPFCRPWLFTMEAEKAHELALRSLQVLGAAGPLRAMLEWANQVRGTRPIELFGLKFPNAVGLAAGFDKNALVFPAARALGFGHVEIGTVTLHAQPGNPRPRMFRLPEQEALINRLGFPNDGAEAVAQRLSRYPARGRRIPLGVNLGKSKTVPLEQAPNDYLACFNLLADHADYFAINVSSPNTPELRRLQSQEFLPGLLKLLRKTSRDRARKLGQRPTPLLLKIAPDLSFDEIDELLASVAEHEIDGVIATNTTIARPGIEGESEAGGLSGRPLHARVVDIVRFISLATGGRLPIIGCGGVMQPADAHRLMDNGAALVQIYTGLVYRGPFFARDLARALSWRHREWV
jgi:dihydroorotate dehydrogenase